MGFISPQGLHIPVVIILYPEAEHIYKFHEQKLLSPLGIEVLDINQYIPPLYWTSKQHQCQYKIRFIAGSSKCQNKHLPIKLSLALKCINGGINAFTLWNRRDMCSLESLSSRGCSTQSCFVYIRVPLWRHRVCIATRSPRKAALTWDWWYRFNRG